MKVFITGGAGFIGSNFIRHVLSLGDSYTVVNFDKLTYAGNLANLESVAGDPRYQFVKGDICDPGAVTQAMRGCDVVVHFAAESHVDRSIYEPAPVIQTNITGTFILLQVARTLNMQRFLHVSTQILGRITSVIVNLSFIIRMLSRRLLGVLMNLATHRLPWLSQTQDIIGKSWTKENTPQ